MAKFLVFGLLLLTTALHAQVAERNLIFDPALKPFYHGVASGDPSTSSVVIWTRVTPDNSTPLEVAYKVARDTGFQQVIASGTAQTDENSDHTLKVTVAGLQPGTTYYYYFEALGFNSVMGRAKTLPAGTIDHLRLGVVSCGNYEAGYFNAYGLLAEQNDLDAVLHLGDYIYEYGATPVVPTRANEPATEILTLSDYRTRYSLYRLDPDLRRFHQQHTVISVWDDHESANDSYTAGAQNHQSNEGSWEARKAISKQVYFEWMPVATQVNQNIYRQLQFGNLADVLMLDTRLEGRDIPPPNFDTPDTPVRHIMSETQQSWLTDNLRNSTARWKIMGNQVLFSTFNVGFAGGILDGNPDPTNIDSIRQVENAFIDNWESYPTQRNSIIDTIRNHQIDNVIIVSGDSHCSWAFDVTKLPVKYPVASMFNLPQPNPFVAATGEGYNKTTGEGSWAVEFGAPSISSNNFDETVGLDLSNQFETLISAPIQPFNLDYNPHLKYVDLDRHGFIILDLRSDTAQANYYYVQDKWVPGTAGAFGQAAYTVKDQNRVFTRMSPSQSKPQQDVPTSPYPFGTVSTQEADASLVMGIFPNPASEWIFVQLALNFPTEFILQLHDDMGQLVLEQPVRSLDKGLHQLPVDVSSLASGKYKLSIWSALRVLAKTIIVVRP